MGVPGVGRTWSGFKLGLHFPVPGLLLASGEALAQAIAARGVALAPPDRQVPLLPPGIAAKAALSTQERRSALTVEVLLNKGFAIEAYTVGLRRVRAFAEEHSRAATALTGGLYLKAWAISGTIILPDWPRRD